ncbi:MAG: hypothetical protein D6711_18705 [Chloroflexi bacterium]|nr:MAG: hypothetical protein D6711_18705 [Chloroflexota bacterium]
MILRGHPFFVRVSAKGDWAQISQLKIYILDCSEKSHELHEFTQIFLWCVFALFACLAVFSVDSLLICVYQENLCPIFLWVFIK